jgi:hypothetical protein
MASLRVSDEFINCIKESARVNFRSIGKQVEYLARIGKTAEENPDLSIDFIKDCLEGLREIENKETTEFKFSKPL